MPTMIVTRWRRIPVVVRVGVVIGALAISRWALYAGIVFGTLGGGIAARFLGEPAIPLGIFIFLFGVAGLFLLVGGTLGGGAVAAGLYLWRRLHRGSASV
jgi:hypothetical protein